MQQKGASHVFHYIDDYITMGAPESTECLENNTIMHKVCDKLAFPRNQRRMSLAFTGIEIDSVAMELCLPAEKLAHMKTELASWRGRKACKKWDRLSLTGVLSHECKVVRAGRTFLRRLINLSMVGREDQWGGPQAKWQGGIYIHLAFPSSLLFSGWTGILR